MPEDRNEFLEVYNAGREPIDLFNYTVDDGDGVDRIVAWQDSALLVQYPNVLINTTWLKPGAYAVIIDPEYTDSAGIGGYYQPYRFADSTLIVTVANTTIGNGLAGNDPIVILSPYGDTTTFGTPADPTDRFPEDAGDGISWEKIDLYGPDLRSNWAISVDSAGCSPGRLNSVATYFDLVITGVSILDSAKFEPGTVLTVVARVKNSGFVTSPPAQVCAWFASGDTLARIDCPRLTPAAETVFVFNPVCPSVQQELRVAVFCPGDKDSLNNLHRLQIAPGSRTRLLWLENSSFSPDGDGFEDSLLIFFSLPEIGGRLTIKVFDLQGRCVRTVLAGSKPTERSGRIYWNGRNDSGVNAGTGVYAVTVEYRYSGRIERAKLPLFLIRR